MKGNMNLAPPVSLLSDEKGKRRAGQSESSHIIGPLALRVTKTAQDVVSGQGLLGRWVCIRKGENPGALARLGT